MLLSVQVVFEIRYFQSSPITGHTLIVPLIFLLGFEARRGFDNLQTDYMALLVPSKVTLKICSVVAVHFRTREYSSHCFWLVKAE